MSPKYSRAKKKINEPKGAEHDLKEKKGGGHGRLCIFHPLPLGACLQAQIKKHYMDYSNAWYPT